MKDITKMREGDEEYKKCLSSPLYFYNNYVRKDHQPELTQAEYNREARAYEIAHRNSNKIDNHNPYSARVTDVVPVEFRYHNSSAYIMPGVKMLNYKEVDLINDVADYFSIKVEDMKKRVRYRTIVRPRQVAMYLLCKRYPQNSLSTIGDMLGGFGHPTVINAIKVVKNDMKSSQLFKDMVNEIDEIIDTHIVEKIKARNK